MSILDEVISDFKIEKEVEQKLRKIINDPEDINEIDFKLSLIMAIQENLQQQRCLKITHHQ